MNSTSNQDTNKPPNSPMSVRDRAISDKDVKALASSIYDQLRNKGCRASDMISISSQLISFITAEIRNNSRQ